MTGITNPAPINCECPIAIYFFLIFLLMNLIIEGIKAIGNSKNIAIIVPAVPSPLMMLIPIPEIKISQRKLKI